MKTSEDLLVPTASHSSLLCSPLAGRLTTSGRDCKMKNSSVDANELLLVYMGFR